MTLNSFRKRSLYAATLILVIGVLGFYGLSVVQDGSRHKTMERKAVKEIWFCPMHTDFRQETPGRCPICGMDLVKLEKSPTGGKRGDHEHATVSLSPDEQRRAGIQTEKVTFGPLKKTIRTVGRVDYDETRLFHVHARFEGFIEDVFGNYVGQRVKKNEPLFSVYSPEVLKAQNESLVSIKQARTEADAKGSIDAAKRRFALWDIDEKDIEKILKTKEPLRAVTISSPGDGFITSKTALKGMRITPEETIYDIADISVVWVLADVYESDLPLVRQGDKGRFTMSFVPGREWEAKVAFINPVLDEKTRTVKVRLELINSDNLLKPGMFGDVEIRPVIGEGLSVPEDAVLISGERRIVFVVRSDGHFEPREVVTGARLKGRFEIKSGLSADEVVAGGANFLLDAESRLKGALQGQISSSDELSEHQH